MGAVVLTGEDLGIEVSTVFRVAVAAAAVELMTVHKSLLVLNCSDFVASVFVFGVSKISEILVRLLTVKYLPDKTPGHF